MRKTLMPKGPLKTIRMGDAPNVIDPVAKKRGRQKVAVIETKTRGLEVQCEKETFYVDVINIEGPSRIISSSVDPRIETYAAVTCAKNEAPFGVFLLQHQGQHLQVIARDEYFARAMHPEEGFEWDPRKKQWKDADGALQGENHYWPSPNKLSVRRLGDEEFAEVEERLHFWED